MDDKKNEIKTSRAETVFSVIATIVGAVATGFAACWGAQTYLPYGDLVNNLLPGISAIVAFNVVALVGSLLLKAVKSARRVNDFNEWGEEADGGTGKYTPWQIIVASVFCPLCAGIGGMHAARMAGDATGVVRGLWIAGGAIVGWYATMAVLLVVAIVVGAIWSFFAALFSRKTSGIGRCWLLVLAGIALVIAGSVHGHDLMRMIGLALVALSIIALFVLAALKRQSAVSPFNLGVKNMPQTDEQDVQAQDLIRIKLSSWIDARKGVFPPFNGAIVDIECVEANKYSGQGDGQQVRWLFKINLDETKEDIAAAVTCFQIYAPFIARDCANLPDGEFYQDADSWYLAFMGDEEPSVAEPILFASPTQSPVHQQEVLAKELEWQDILLENAEDVSLEIVCATMDRVSNGWIHSKAPGTGTIGDVAAVAWGVPGVPDHHSLIGLIMGEPSGAYGDGDAFINMLNEGCDDPWDEYGNLVNTSEQGFIDALGCHGGTSRLDTRDLKYAVLVKHANPDGWVLHAALAKREHAEFIQGLRTAAGDEARIVDITQWVADSIRNPALSSSR